LFITGKSFKWVDWSEVGVADPCQDIGQLLISDVPTKFARQHARSLVAKYHAALVELGVVGEEEGLELWRAVLVGGIAKWVNMICILANIAAISDRALEYFGANLLGFMEMAEEDFGLSVFPMDSLVIIV